MNVKRAVPHESIVIIPKDAGMASSQHSYVPQTITVEIGVNNTVRWINHDYAAAWIWADNSDDPNFYNATQDDPNHTISKTLMVPNQTFAYTFTKVGEFGYHGKPWMRGTVIVEP